MMMMMMMIKMITMIIILMIMARPLFVGALWLSQIEIALTEFRITTFENISWSLRTQ